MKRIFFLFIFLFVLFFKPAFLLSGSSHDFPDLLPPLKKKIKIPVVVIDAGHGGNDYGATAKSGLMEKEVTLDIAHRTRKYLESIGFKVVMTRNDDKFIPLKERVRICENVEGDLFLSIHANAASNLEAVGFETFFLSPNKKGSGIEKYGGLLTYLALPSVSKKSCKWAKIVQEEMAGFTGGVDRGIKMARFHVLRHSKVPAVLVETGFLSNLRESAALATSAYRSKVALALAQSVRRFKRW